MLAATVQAPWPRPEYVPELSAGNQLYSDGAGWPPKSPERPGSVLGATVPRAVLVMASVRWGLLWPVSGKPPMLPQKCGWPTE